MTRPTDDQVRLFATGAFELTENQVADTIAELAAEVLEARERGTTGTVDQLAANRIPQNMKDGLYVPSPRSALSVAAWTPEQDGKGKTTQVHLVHDLGHLVPGFRAVTRFKSGHGVDLLLQQLYEYRCEVWPGYRGLRLKGKAVAR